VITVSRRGAERLRAGHLWVYRSDIAAPEEVPRAALVHVQDQRGRKLGSALSSSSSQIAVRLISAEELAPGSLPELVRRRLGAAISFRRERVRDTDAYRVVFSESDLLPGLVVDKYNDILTFQVLTQAFDREDLRQVVTGSLTEHFPSASIVERVDAHIRELEQLSPIETRLLTGTLTSTR